MKGTIEELWHGNIIPREDSRTNSKGKRYKDLPEKIREGIDRRQLQVITLLKESASSIERADRIKRLVFERLNTGGVKLLSRENRNAIYGLG